MPTRLTPARAALLRRINTETVYVYRDPATVGAGLSRRTLDSLFAEPAQAAMGPYEPTRGRRLVLTGHGQALLDGFEQQAAAR